MRQKNWDPARRNNRLTFMVSRWQCQRRWDEHVDLANSLLLRLQAFLYLQSVSHPVSTLLLSLKGRSDYFISSFHHLFTYPPFTLLDKVKAL